MLNTKNKILITGADGFLGRYLAKALMNYDIYCFDIRDGDIVSHKFYNADVFHVFHLAAKTFVPESWQNPYHYYMVNFMGTENILEYCRKIGASLTFLSTYTYGVPKYLPIDELHPCQPNTVYNHSKFLADDLCKFYAVNYGISITVLRVFNIYGEGQRGDFLIPRIMEQAFHSPHIEVMDLRPRRDYVYIKDLIDAMLLTIGNKGYHLYNIGSGISMSVKEICNCIINAVGVSKKIIEKEMPRKNEVLDIVANISKAKKELGWQPKIGFEEGIREIVKMYQMKGEK
jgi:nucleoside-diphosphate-sugar epimerase